MNITLSSYELNDILLNERISTTEQINDALQQITNSLSSLKYISIEDDTIETVVNTINKIISVFKSDQIYTPDYPIVKPEVIDPQVEIELKKYNDLIINKDDTLNLAASEDIIQTIYFQNGELQSSSTTTDESNKILLIDNYNAKNIYEIYILDNELHQREVLNLEDKDKTLVKKSIILSDELNDIQYKLYIYDGILNSQQI